MPITWLSAGYQHSPAWKHKTNKHCIRAAWSGTRIILRQVSPEANGIFDFIMAMYHGCGGDWEKLATESQVDVNEVQKFVDYVAMFLSNIGNYFVSSDPLGLSGLGCNSCRDLEIRSLFLVFPEKTSRSWLHVQKPLVPFLNVSGILCLRRHPMA